MTSPSTTDRFRAARDLLLDLRDDHDAACARFAWPRFEEFNWALDWFDPMARGNTRPALTIVDGTGSRTVAYAELAESSSRVANWLRAIGVRRGDRILMMLDNQVAVWELLIAAMKAGAVVVPTFTTISAADLADRIDRAGVQHIVTTDALTDAFGAAPAHLTRVCVGDAVTGWIPWADAHSAPAAFVPDAPTGADDLMLLYFTSGTTSRPKLVPHTHTSYPVGHLSGMYWNGLRPGDVHLNVSAPGWAKHAWSSFFVPFNAEATVVSVTTGEDATLDVLDRLVAERATSFCAPPTVWRALTQHDLALWPVDLREAGSVGEPLNPTIVDDVRAAWGRTVRDGFGQSETTAQIGNSPALPVKPGSMGKPLPGYDIVLLDPRTGRPADEGEICVDLTRRPVGVMAGYLGDAARNAETFAGGCYHTGDLAHRDADGYLFHLGRNDDVFKSYDFRISPFELESVLLRHSDVAEAAVVPALDDAGLVVPKAFVALAAGGVPSAATARSILADSRRDLAPHQWIRRIEFAALPKTTSGKIRRAELRQRDADASFEAADLLPTAPPAAPGLLTALHHNQKEHVMRDITVYSGLFDGGLHDGRIDWAPYVQPGRTAVDVRWLYTGEETGATGAEAYLAHFHAGSHGDLHEHLGFELLLILEGELHNDNGDRYPAGTLFVEEPGSVHQVSSPAGCMALVVREKATRRIPAQG